MRRNLSSILSVVAGGRSITLAQVSSGKASATTRRVGQLSLEDNWIDQPSKSGAALRDFLDSHGFDASSAIVGVPASWLLAQEKDLPPAVAAAASAILRLAAERLAAAGSTPLVADYAGPISATAPSRVLLVGMLKSQLEKIEKFIAAAGLSLQAVCPTSIGALTALAGQRSLLRLVDGGAELVTQDGGVPTMIRPIVAPPLLLAAEAKRTLAMRNGSAHHIAIAGDGNVGLAEREALAARFDGARLLDDESCPQIGFDAAALNGAAAGMTRSAALPAAALGAAALADTLQIDFASSKLIEAAPRRFGRRTLYTIAAVAAAIIGLVGLEWMVESREGDEAELAAKVGAITPQLKSAQAAIDRLEFGRPYFAPHPPQLDCLKSLTLAFNYSEPIWTENLQIRDNGIGQIAGKAANQALIFSLIDRLKAQPLLSNVQFANVQSGTGREREINYNISFNFTAGPIK